MSPRRERRPRPAAAGGARPPTAEARLRAVLAALFDVQFEVDAAGVIYDYHAPRPAWLNPEPEPFIGRRIRDILPPAAAGCIHAALAQAAERGASRGQVYTLPDPEGLRFFELAVTPLEQPAAPDRRWIVIARDITARRQAEMELQKSEARFAVCARLSRAFVWEVDAAGLYTYVSASVQDVLGYAPAELVGRRHFYDLHPRATRNRFRSEAFGIFARRAAFADFANPCLARDGRIVWVATHGSPLLQSDGTLRGYCGSDVDITVRKRTEEQLRASEAKYRMLFEGVQDGFISCDIRGRIRDANPAFQALTGYRLAELRRRTILDITAPKWRPAERWIRTHQVLARGHSDVYEKEYLRKDGTRVPVELRVFLVRDDAGRPAGTWSSVRDITERKTAQAALRRANAELEQRVRDRTAALEASQAALLERNEQFNQMAASIQEVFWLLDARTYTLVYASPAYDQIWGRPQGQVKRTRAAWLSRIHAHDRRRVLDCLRRGRLTGAYEPMEFRILMPDGAVHWVATRAWSIRDAAGRLARIAGVSLDITDRRRLEAEILRATESERQRIGHDLHDGLTQSLAAIGYWTESLREKLVRQSRPESAVVRKLEKLVARTLQQAHGMARGLLLTDLKRCGLVPALQELAHGIREMFDLDCRYRGLAGIDLPGPDAASQLYRIAQEAAMNAAKHSRGSLVEIRLSRMRTGLQLAVRDNGRGLAAGTRRRKGLGLEIMRYRAGIIGATLAIESAPGRGTRVKCLVPTAGSGKPGPRRPARRRLNTRPGSTSPAPGNPRRR